MRRFRELHWKYTSKYIIENTNYPRATGGTPITTWLPNQLIATMNTMNDIVKDIDIKSLDNNQQESLLYIKNNVKVNFDKIDQQIKSFQSIVKDNQDS